MRQTYNIYCDESCHLEHDQHSAMALGAVWCPASKTREVNAHIRHIMKIHRLAPDFEIKWTKVSRSKQSFYLDLVDYFYANEDLHFRAIVVKDKSKLNHPAFNQDHDTWYYKMYFTLLSALLAPENQYRIYLDIKDTRSEAKVQQLRDVLCNAKWDFSRSIIERVQSVRSREVSVLQLTDLLLGAVSYLNRGLSGNQGKLAVIERMKKYSRLSLVQTTLLGERKTNIFIWTPRVR